MPSPSPPLGLATAVAGVSGVPAGDPLPPPPPPLPASAAARATALALRSLRSTLSFPLRLLFLPVGGDAGEGGRGKRGSATRASRSTFTCGPKKKCMDTVVGLTLAAPTTTAASAVPTAALSIPDASHRGCKVCPTGVLRTARAHDTHTQLRVKGARAVHGSITPQLPPPQLPPKATTTTPTCTCVHIPHPTSHTKQQTKQCITAAAALPCHLRDGQCTAHTPQFPRGPGQLG